MKIRLFLALVALIVAACAPAVPSTPLASLNGIDVLQASVRLPGGPASGLRNDAASVAGYFVIRNTGASDDSLIGIQADFAGLSMLHESFVDSNGVASMNMVTAVNIPAGQTVELKPGGFHAMFVGLKRDLKAGEQVTLLLQFQKAGALSVQARVTDQ